MEWDVTWEIASSEGEVERGIARVAGDYAIDALTTFFKNIDNKGRRLIGISAIYETLDKKEIERRNR